MPPFFDITTCLFYHLLSNIHINSISFLEIPVSK